MPTANFGSLTARAPEQMMKVLALGLASPLVASRLWSAYAIALVVLGGFVLYAWRRYRLSIDQLARLQGGGEHR